MVYIKDIRVLKDRYFLGIGLEREIYFIFCAVLKYFIRCIEKIEISCLLFLEVILEF